MLVGVQETEAGGRFQDGCDWSDTIIACRETEEGDDRLSMNEGAADELILEIGLVNLFECHRNKPPLYFMTDVMCELDFDIELLVILSL